jgi:hypothetical protein
MNKLIIFGIAILMLTSCNTVRKAFDSERKNSSEEFLVEKKSPLSMPPDFDELPVPQNTNKENDDLNQYNEIESLIEKTDKNISKSEKEVQSSEGDFESSILEKIQNN